MANREVTSKIVDRVLKSLIQEYGEGYATKGLASIELEAIPTGHDDLDSLLTDGAMGVAKGCIIELFGSEASGKCVTKNTYCLTPKGMLTVEEIFNDADVLLDASTGFVDKEYSIVGGKGVEKTSHFYRGQYGSTKTIRITTKDGFAIEGSYNHPVRVMDSNGFLVWRKLQSVSVGDSVCVVRGTKLWNQSSNISEDEASLVGYILGDGNLTPPCRIGFSNTDEDIARDFKNALKNCYGEKILNCVKRYEKTYGLRHAVDYNINSKEFTLEFKKKHGLGNEKSCDKTIPRSIRSASKKSQTAFIRAYFDTDGTFHTDKLNLQFCSCSLKMLQELQLMLLNFNIYAYITIFHNKVYDKDYYELELAGAELDRYSNDIGFNNNAKSNKVKIAMEARNDRIRHTNIDSIPHQNNNIRSLYESVDPEQRSRHLIKILNDIQSNRCNLTYNKLSSIVLSLEQTDCNQHLLSHLKDLQSCNFIYSDVVAIDHGNERTYDFMLPETHSFWSNGILSHNSSVAMRLAASVQKDNKLCIWFDTERSFSYALARINGCDPTKLYLPSLFTDKETKTDDGGFSLLSAGDILERVYKSVCSNIYELVVIDSVAGLIPDKVLADDFDPDIQGVAELARYMARQLGKIAQAAYQTKTAVVFVNQLRDKPGEYFKDRFHTPGGRALKFFSHQRIGMEKKMGAAGNVVIKDEDGSEQIIGHYARCTIVKNRMAAPVHHSIEIPIYYVPYNPDNAKKCYDLSRLLQVTTIRNGVLTWKNGDETVLRIEGEADFLNSIRDKKLESRLAADCVEAAKSEKNQSKKQPIRVSKTIEDLAALYVAEPLKEIKEDKISKKTKKQPIDLDIDV